MFKEEYAPLHAIIDLTNDMCVLLARVYQRGFKVNLDALEEVGEADGVAFEAWFDYAAGGEDVNTVAEYVLNRTPASPRHVVAARNAASPP